MDEYVGGISAHYTTNEPLLTRGLELLGMLKEDLDHIGAEDLHQLQRAWGASAPGPGVRGRDAPHDVPGRKRGGRGITTAPIIRSWMIPIGIASRYPATTGTPGSGKWRRPPCITSSIRRSRLKDPLM